MPMLFEIPTELASSVASGAVERFGAILKDTATGHIVGHIQQTTVLDSILSSSMQGMLKTVSGGFDPLDVVSVVQNQQMLSKLSGLQNSMGLLQNLQISTLALSGAGLGVSVVGFAMVLKRLKSIQSNLEQIDQKIEETTNTRRADELGSLFAKIEADVNGVGYLVNHPNPTGAAEALYQSLMRFTREVEAILKREIEVTKDSIVLMEQIDRQWSLVAVLRICQEAAIQALFHADLLKIAEKFAQDETKRLELLFATIVPDKLARLVSHHEPDWEKSVQARQLALLKANNLADGVMDSTINIAGQASLARSLIESNESGRELLLTAEAETEEPIIFLPHFERA